MSGTCKGSCTPALLRAIKGAGNVPDWMILQDLIVDFMTLP